MPHTCCYALLQNTLEHQLQILQYLCLSVAVPPAANSNTSKLGISAAQAETPTEVSP